jgi:hypothetical protein
MDGIHSAQEEVFRAFDAQKARFISLEWHRRSRKTTMAINLLLREAILNPNSAYGYVGPTYKQARETVWDDPNMLNAYLPPQSQMRWRKNEQRLQVKFGNGSLLRILGADKPDSLRGLDACGVVFDEWALMKEEIWTAIFRPIFAQDPNRWAMFLYTPVGINHATDMHDRARAGRPGWYAKTLTTDTSGLLSAAELAEAAKDMPDWLVRQEFLCHRIADEDAVLITSRLIDALRDHHAVENETRTIIACDPATGGDACPIIVGRNCAIIDSKTLHDRDTMKIVGEIMLMSNLHKTKNVTVDNIGVGKGVADRCRELGLNVISFNSSEQAHDPERFANRRAEAWWATMQLIRDKSIPYPNSADVRRQLASVKVRPLHSNGRIIMEEKSSVRRRIGRSPDDADCFVYLVAGTQQLPPDEPKESRSRYRKARKTGSPWAA